MSDAISPVEYHFECGNIDWRVRSLALEERMSMPFCGELRIVAQEAANLGDLLDQPATLTMFRGEAIRTFRGEVTQVELSLANDGTSHARIRFEPMLARARHTKRNRIFQGLGVFEILTEVVNAVTDLPLDATYDHQWPARDYCVQYDESDLNFIMRLLQDEGLAWFLDDTGDRQRMKIVQATRGFPVIPGDNPEVRIIADRFDEAQEESIQSISVRQRSASPGVVERDWQWLTSPATCHEEPYPDEGSKPRIEVANPRRWAHHNVKDSARLEYELRAAQDVLAEGTSNVTVFSPGFHFDADLGGDDLESLLLLRVMHRADCPEVELQGAQHRSGPNYTNTFECQLLKAPHRPQRTTPKPRIHSLHTAVVTGPEGEEVYTDEHGRIRVRMHWDRSDSPPELSSCWLRVGQMWSGPGWGTLFLPRVGMEVLVAFIDGDPDRPICTGCVYNGQNPRPYALPEDRTKSTIKSNSSPGAMGSMSCALKMPRAARRYLFTPKKTSKRS